MLPVIWILGIGVAAILALAPFWSDIAMFVQNAIRKVMEKLNRNVEYSQISLQREGENAFEISRQYSREADHWHETTIRRQVPLSQIPQEYIDRMKNQVEIDVSEDLKLQLTQ